MSALIRKRNELANRIDECKKILISDPNNYFTLIGTVPTSDDMETKDHDVIDKRTAALKRLINPLMLSTHPDRNPRADANAQMEKLKTARDVLIKPDSRRLHAEMVEKSYFYKWKNHLTSQPDSVAEITKLVAAQMKTYEQQYIKLQSDLAMYAVSAKRKAEVGAVAEIKRFKSAAAPPAVMEVHAAFPGCSREMLEKLGGTVVSGYDIADRSVHFVVGNTNRISASGCRVFGDHNSISGSFTYVCGKNDVVAGMFNIVHGSGNNIANLKYSIIIDSECSFKDILSQKGSDANNIYVRSVNDALRLGVIVQDQKVSRAYMVRPASIIAYRISDQTSLAHRIKHVRATVTLCRVVNIPIDVTAIETVLKEFDEKLKPRPMVGKLARLFTPAKRIIQSAPKCYTHQPAKKNM